MRVSASILVPFVVGCLGGPGGADDAVDTGAPVELSVDTVTEASARLRWLDRSDDEEEFVIERWDAVEARWIELATAGPNTTVWRVSGLEADTDYGIQVHARNAMGVTPPSNTVWFTTEASSPVERPSPGVPDGAPEDFQVRDVTATGATATWADTSSNEDAFVIEAWDERSVGWVEIATPEANATSWVFEALDPGTEYGMRIAARNGAGRSRLTAEQWFTTLPADTSCGDGACDPGESCGGCASDCGTCPARGGDWRHLTGTADYEVTDDFEGDPGSFWGHGAWTRRETCGSDPAASGRALTFHFQPDPDGDAMSEQRFRFPESVQVEMRYRIFVPPNYRHRDAPGADNNKGLFMLWSGPYTAANFACHSEHWRTEGGSQPSLHCYYSGRDYGHSYPGGRTFETEDGGWHDVRVFMEMAEHEGDHGRVVVYWDGAVIIDTETTPASGALDDWREAIVHRGEVNFLDQGYLMGWSNSGFDEPTVFCIDDFAFRANATHR